MKSKSLEAVQMVAALDAARPVGRTPAQLQREIDDALAVSRDVDAGSENSMPMHHWVSSVIDASGVSVADMEKYVTRKRLHTWFSHGETVHGAVKMIERFVVNGKREERADSEVDTLRRVARAAVAASKPAASVSDVVEVGSVVSPTASDVRYRVVSVLPTERGGACKVEAIGDVAHVADGRQPRKLHYSERRFTLVFNRDTGHLIDDRWRGWRVVG